MDQPATFPPGSKPAIILEAAAALFLQHGYGAVTMDAVAKEAGVSKATLYAHFAGKDALFETLVRAECNGLVSGIAASDLDGMPPAEALRLIGRQFLTMLMSPKAVAGYRIVVGEAVRFPELAGTFYRAGPAVAMALVREFLTRADAGGRLAIPDPAIAAEQFLGMLKSHLHLRLLLGMEREADAAEIDRLIEAAVALFARGYAP